MRTPAMLHACLHNCAAAQNIAARVAAGDFAAGGAGRLIGKALAAAAA